MRLKTLRNDMSLEGKRVLVRMDANVPVGRAGVVDGRFGKIARSAVTLEWLRQKGARIVVLTHLGRPAGKRVLSLSTRAVAKRLSELLGMPVSHTRQCVGAGTERAVSRLKNGQILVLENLRFDVREEKGDLQFAKELARLGDLYVNDAFAVCHRAHASVALLPTLLPSYAGPLLAHEVSVLEKVSRTPKQPLVIVVGGLKMISKLPILEKLLPLASHVFIGGALAHPFFLAQGYGIGESVYEKEGLPIAKKLLAKYKDKIVLPSDVNVVTRLRKDARMRTCFLDEVEDTDHIVDLGEESLRTLASILKQAKTIIWNGPLGYTEFPRFCEGTNEVARLIASLTGRATTVIGGGDTMPLVERLGLVESVSLASTGGAAMLEFLADGDMPGLAPLMRT